MKKLNSDGSDSSESGDSDSSNRTATFDSRIARVSAQSNERN